MTYRWVDHTAEVELEIEAAGERAGFPVGGVAATSVEIVERAGLAARVARLRPVGVVKG